MFYLYIMESELQHPTEGSITSKSVPVAANITLHFIPRDYVFPKIPQPSPYANAVELYDTLNLSTKLRKEAYINTLILVENDYVVFFFFFLVSVNLFYMPMSLTVILQISRLLKLFF